MRLERTSVPPAILLLACAWVGCARTPQSQNDLGGFVDGLEGTISAGKREAVRNGLGAERLGIQSFVDEEVDAMLTRFDDTGRGLIDHFFDRMVRILLGAALFLTLLALLLIVGLRRGSSASTRGSSSSQSEDED